MPPNSEQPERRVDFALLKKDVADNKEAAEETLRILRGYNKTPGLIADVAAHGKSIDALKNRKKTEGVYSIVGGFLGGFAAIAAKFAIWRQ